MPSKSPEPDLDLILESMIYLYSESRRVMRALAEEYGLTGSQLLVLKLLEPRGQMSLSALSEEMRAKNSTVTGIVDRMERDGLVARKRSDGDRRVVHLELTAKGKKLVNDVKPEPKQLFRALLEELPPRDAAELERIMTKLVSRARTRLAERGLGPEPG